MTWRGDTETFEEMKDRKRKARMSRVDDMPPASRELVHEYGLNVVNGFMENGVVKPNKIRHLIELVLDEFSPTRGSHSIQGVRTANQYGPNA